jgi:hypothetical protein
MAWPLVAMAIDHHCHCHVDMMVDGWLMAKASMSWMAATHQHGLSMIVHGNAMVTQWRWQSTIIAMP